MTDAAATDPRDPPSRISPRFRIAGELGRGGAGVVYEAEDLARRRSVALKTLRVPNADNIYRIKREFRALADLQHPNLVALEELHVAEGSWFFTMELVRGVPFIEWVCPGQHAPPSASDLTMTRTGAPGAAVVESAERAPPRFDADRLSNAIGQLAGALHFVHGVGRVHCDVKPSNTLVTAEGRVVLLDFGLTQVWDGTERGEARTHPEGTIRYMAPEQGTLGALTPAADMYALGVMLFEALTGEVPFVGAGVQVLADKQRRTPPRPSSIVQEVPPVLDRLCTQLLTPDADARPTAREVLRALAGPDAKARRGLDQALSETLAERFVGRVERLREIDVAFRAATGPGGTLSALLVRGEPGVGKTALVREFVQRVADRDGALVLSSRCNEQEAMPLRALDGAVDRLSTLLLSVASIRLEAALPGDTTPLLALFPVLERVPAIAVRALAPRDGLPPAELRRRCAAMLRGLLGLFAKLEPLVLFVDDLQWVDDASLAFLGLMMDDDRRLPMLLLATCRPGTEPARDAAARLSATSQRWQGRTTVMELGGLTPDEAGELLDSPWARQIGAARRRDLIRDAEGHPFLLRELARYVARVSGAAGEALPTLLHALSTRLDALPEIDLELLQTIALAGVPIDLDTVADATGLELVDCAYGVQRLKGQQLLRITQRAENKVLEPYHDRVREVVETSMDLAESERRGTIHGALGRALLSRAEHPLGAAVYPIVENLNRAPPPSPGEVRMELAQLNLEAGTQALAATDYGTSLRYAEAGIALLSSQCWTEQFELSFELHLAQMQAAYLGGDHDRAAELFMPLSQRATKARDIARVYETKTNLDMNGFRDLDALESASEGLARLGHPLPKAPGKLRVLTEVVRARRQLRSMEAVDFLKLPHTDDDRVQGVSMLYLTANHAGLRANPNLMGVIMARGAQLVARHGLTHIAPVLIANYAWLQAMMGRYEEAEALRMVVEELCERYGEHPRMPWSAVAIDCDAFIAPWHEPMSQCRERLHRRYEIELRASDDILAYIASTVEIAMLRFEGADVDTVLRCAERAEQLNLRRKLDNFARFARVGVEMCHVLKAPPDDDPFRRFEALRPQLEGEDSSAAAVWHLARAELALRVDDLEVAQDAVQGAIALRHHGAGGFSVQAVTFLDAMSACRLLAGASRWRRWRLQRRIRKAIDQHRVWAERCEANFGAPHQVLRGQWHVAQGRPQQGRECFSEAARIGEACGHRHMQALALVERAKTQGGVDAARRDLQHAAALYDAQGDIFTATLTRQRLDGV